MGMSTLAIVGIVALVVLAILLSFKLVRRIILVVGLFFSILFVLLMIDGKITFTEIGETLFKWSYKAAKVIDSTAEKTEGKNPQLAGKLDAFAKDVRSVQRLSTEAQKDLDTLRDENASASARLEALRHLADAGVPLIINDRKQNPEEISQLVQELESKDKE
jgi:uncharacterized membrane protein YgaE (UPF0421/DUF939 family)